MFEGIELFLGSETPFLLLYVILFVFVLKQAKSREDALKDEIKREIKTISKDIKILTKVWQILLEKELKKKGSEKE